METTTDIEGMNSDTSRLKGFNGDYSKTFSDGDK